MIEPKPSEVLRPLLNERDQSRMNDVVLQVLDRIDSEQRRLAEGVTIALTKFAGRQKGNDPVDAARAWLNKVDAAKVDGPQPASEWPKWTATPGTVWRYPGPNQRGMFWNVPSIPHGSSGLETESTYESCRMWDERDITHAEAIALIPAIADTYPLPAKCERKPVEAPKLAELADGGLEAEAREWSERLIEAGRGNTVVYRYHDQVPGSGQELAVCEHCDQSAVVGVARTYLQRNLTAFAARALERQRARMASAEDVTGLKNALELTKRDRDSARAECERLRGLIEQAAKDAKGGA